MKITIKTLHNLEPVLKKEAEALGATNVELKRRAISCEGNLEFLYRANLELRTALKVLIPVHQFKAMKENELYDAVRAHDWTQYLKHTDTFAIDHTVFSDFFKHSQFASLKTKDAIVDQFRDKTGKRPSVNRDYPDVQFNLHGFKDRFTISLDSSLKPLNQRGYRSKGHQAPLNEVLAAGMIALSDWSPQDIFHDPMCGTGTLLTEAAMMARNQAPNLFRKEFGFKGWSNYQPNVFHRVKSELENKIRPASNKLMGSDLDENAIRMAKQAMRAARMGREVQVKQRDFFRFVPDEKRGVVIMNPPYGERIGNEIEAFYEKIGDHLKQNFTGMDAWILSSNKSALKKIGLQPEQRIELINGKLKCEFCHYKLY
jgi:putative N6-adenine-specific DNA methylase